MVLSEFVPKVASDIFFGFFTTKKSRRARQPKWFKAIVTITTGACILEFMTEGLYSRVETGYESVVPRDFPSAHSTTRADHGGCEPPPARTEPVSTRISSRPVINSHSRGIRPAANGGISYESNRGRSRGLGRTRLDGEPRKAQRAKLDDSIISYSTGHGT